MTSLNTPWLNLPALQQLFSLFEKEGSTLRLVGGSVRDGLLGLPVNDIDLAVDQNPQWVMHLLKTNHIKAIPTGIDHGTITAVIDKRPYQITTLRIDVKTFGRRADVAFTDDWVQDALRRDFTINAIYADKNGQLFDPVGGIEDLQNHRVRFIGEASQRIKEDYLRILRFFRFSARFGHEPYDPEGLEACKTYASHLPHLARERITDEFLKLLGLPSPLYTLGAMNETGVLSYILHPGTWEDLKILVALENILAIPPSALVRLAGFHPVLEAIKHQLRLSKSQESYLDFLIKNHDFVTSESFKHQAYRWGKEKVFDLSLLQTAQRVSSAELSLEQAGLFLIHLHECFESWIIPSFPLTGSDILSHGIKEGNRIGILLRTVETWWIEQDFVPDRAACLAYLVPLL
jgi:poly(A) polymerase